MVFPSGMYCLIYFPSMGWEAALIYTDKTRKDPRRPEKTRKDPKRRTYLYREDPKRDTYLYREDPRRPEKTRKDPKRHPKRPKKTRKDIFIFDVSEWKWEAFFSGTVYVLLQTS